MENSSQEKANKTAKELNKIPQGVVARKSVGDFLKTNVAALALSLLSPNWPKSLWGKIKMFFTGLPTESLISQSPFLFTVTLDAAAETSIPTTPGLPLEPETLTVAEPSAEDLQKSKMAKMVKVTLFGGEKTLRLDNLGNDKSVHFNYLLTGYFGGGLDGYRAMVQRSCSHGFRFGRIRVESKDENNLSTPLIIENCEPTGSATTYPAITGEKTPPSTLADQQILIGSAEYEIDAVVYGGTSISYFQMPGTEVTFYLFTIKETYPVYSLVSRLKKAFRIIFIKDLFKN